MTPQSAFSTGQWQDEQKKPQPQAQLSATPTQPPATSAISVAPTNPTPQAPPASRNYYGQQPKPPQQPAQQPFQPAAPAAGAFAPASNVRVAGGPQPQWGGGAFPGPQRSMAGVPPTAPSLQGGNHGMMSQSDWGSQSPSAEEGIVRGAGIDKSADSYTGEPQSFLDAQPEQPEPLPAPVEMPKPGNTHTGMARPGSRQRQYYGQ